MNQRLASFGPALFVWGTANSNSNQQPATSNALAAGSKGWLAIRLVQMDEQWVGYTLGTTWLI